MSLVEVNDSQVKKMMYRGYEKRNVPAHDAELTATDGGTPMGEYMRQFWQPVCLSEELTDVPKAIRILGEDLVAFRDLSGNVGVMHRHCAHRGASLEFGVIAQNGIKCCYHGWHYDLDGTLLSAPCETDDTRLKQTVCQGAYPAFERDGLVFAYLGPPERKPPFPEYDTYSLPRGTKLVPFSNIYPCNWLQVFENIMDHLHTSVLHNRMVAEGVPDEIASEMSLDTFSGEMPIMQWEPTRNGNGMVFIACRRKSGDRIWVRITEMIFPNYLQIGATVTTAETVRHSTTGLTRWHVPVDDTNMIIFGWRHFNSEVDPDGLGSEKDCGVDKVDFLGGQSGGRSYEEAQRAPGDWEALCSQRPIAVHALEHPATSDVGVYMCRKLLREAVRGKTPADPLHDRLQREGESLPLYAQDSVLWVSRLANPSEDRKLVMSIGKRVLEIMRSADRLPMHERDAHVRKHLDEIDGGERQSPQSSAAGEASQRP